MKVRKVKRNQYTITGSNNELAQARKDIERDLRRINYCYPQF